jgi:hypothetical protein
MNPLSTADVARRVGVHPITVERWLSQDATLAPKTLRIGGRVVRLWTLRDVERLKRFKATQRRGPKIKNAKVKVKVKQPKSKEGAR